MTAPWVGHDCLPGQREGIYVNAARDWPVGTWWACPMCDTKWIRGQQRWGVVGVAVSDTTDVQLVLP